MSDQRSTTLAQAWARNRAVLDELKDKVVSSEHYRVAPEQRARAFHQLFEIQAMSYNFALAPRLLHPRIYHNTAWQTDVYCAGGNGPDFHYGTVFLDGAQTYRLKGNIKDSAMLLAQHNSALPGSPSSHMVANYDFSDFDIGEDGSLEVLLGPDVQGNNTIKLVPESGYQWLLFRPTVLGSGRAPADLSIERISDISVDHYADDDFTEEATARRIDFATDYCRYVIEEWTLGFYTRVLANSGGVNIFKPIGPAISGEVGSPTAEYVFCIFELEDDEALIIELSETPDGPYWGFQLFDIWLRSLDFRARQSTLNSAMSVADSDGVIRFVVSRRDPGVANWLDTTGHKIGQILLRNYRASHGAEPTATRVKLDELKSHLPADSAWITPEERATALTLRRAEYARRHGE